MAVQYYLVPVGLTDDVNDYRAVTVSVGSISEDDLISRVAVRNTGVPVQSIRSVVQTVREIKKELLRDGFTITTDDTNYKVDIAGVFNGKDDVFDPKRHQMRANPRLGKGFTGMFQDIYPVKLNEVVDHSKPNPTDFEDMKSNTVNATLSPGGIGQLIGMRLSFDTSDASQGIFMVNNTTKDETKVTTVAHNKPGKLIFAIPETLIKGDYEIEVRSLPKNNKEIKSGKLPDIVSVL
jgi:hypothetical protein